MAPNHPMGRYRATSKIISQVGWPGSMNAFMAPPSNPNPPRTQPDVGLGEAEMRVASAAARNVPPQCAAEADSSSKTERLSMKACQTSGASCGETVGAWETPAEANNPCPRVTRTGKDTHPATMPRTFRAGRTQVEKNREAWRQDTLPWITCFGGRPHPRRTWRRSTAPTSNSWWLPSTRQTCFRQKWRPFACASTPQKRFLPPCRATP